VRDATPGFASTDESSAAPFQHGPWLFSHTGVLADWPRARKTLVECTLDVPEASAAVDSALLFGVAVAAWQAGASLGQGLAETVAAACAVGGGRLSFLAGDGEGIAATAYGDPLVCLESDTGVLLASEPLDDDNGWRRLPPASLVEAGRSASARSTPDRTATEWSPMPESASTPRLDVHLTASDLVATMRDDVRRGLTGAPKQLPPKYFYDARGSELFENITRLPEYYPTQTERGILEANADEIALVSGADTLVELGSGSSEKTRLLLDALTHADHLRRYVPVDVSGAALESAMAGLASDYPDLELHGVVADFEHHLEQLPAGGTRLVAFLGSTIGNLEPADRHDFLTMVGRGLGAGDTLLLGTDLVKDPARLVAAYDDAAGVTAEFNRNVLHVLNRQLGADFDPASFDHVARWNAGDERIEMWLRARLACRVQIAALQLGVGFERGEEMRTETSAKFRPEGLSRELAAAGLAVIGAWTDPDGDYALTLCRTAH
jgi:dimethylhistidine N-methyltransferase